MDSGKTVDEEGYPYLDMCSLPNKEGLSSDLLMDFMNAAPYSFHLYNSDLRLLAINKQAYEKTGWTNEVGKHITEISSTIIASGRYKEYLNVLQTGKTFHVDSKLPDNINGEVYVAIRAFKVGEGLGLIIRDITPRKEREIKLEKAEKSYRQLLDSSSDAVLVFHGPVIVYANNKAAEYVGLESAEELKGKLFEKFIHPFDREFMRKSNQDRLNGIDVPKSFELTLLNKKGGSTIVEAHVSFTEFEGKPAIISFARDITERKKTELELEKSSSELRERVKELTFLFKALKIINEVVSVEELGPKIVEILPSAMGLTEKAIPYIQIDEFVFTGEGYTPELVNKLETGIQCEYGSVGKVAVFYPDETEFMLPEEQHMLDALSESLGNWYEGVHASNAFIQYTENLQEKVEEKSRELIDAERMAAAGRIAAMVGHDLRTPLQTIRSAVHIIRNQHDITGEMLDLIDESVKRASDMIEEFRNQTRDTPLRRETVYLSEIIRDTIEGAVIPNTIKLKLDIIENEPLMTLDPSKIRRVFDNLVANAVDAMPDSGILSVKLDHMQTHAIITVTDTGIGISEDNKKNLFKPFHTTKETGLGLGLPFCKRTVEAHGGKIQCDSVVGSGTTFKIILPLDEPQDYEMLDLDYQVTEAD